MIHHNINHAANQALDGLRTLSGKPLLPGTEAHSLLAQRATFMDLQLPQGQCSANGSCRLYQCQDGEWIALNLSRPLDWELLPALFMCNTPLTEWQEIEIQVKQQAADTLVTQGRLLGLAIAVTGARDVAVEKSWFNITARGPYRHQRPGTPLVLDLSALWAGPLCSHLLQQCGARVIKVESKHRPDGARLNRQPGAHAFYECLNQEKEFLQLDFSRPEDLQQLKILMEQADIIIEGSRPRALKQLGFHAEEIVSTQAGKIWISITGYGRSEPEAHWIAYGDDAAISAGLFNSIDGKPVFIGDAIADPLTGLHAALAAYTFWQKGKSVLLDINLHRVSRYCATHTGA